MRISIKFIELLIFNFFLYNKNNDAKFQHKKCRNPHYIKYQIKLKNKNKT